MYIYADETGNSGRNLFDSQHFYRLGAVFSVEDIDPVLEGVIKPLLAVHKLDRIHANALPERTIVEIGNQILDTLETFTAWQFHLTAIHKPYVVTTKFVDTIFDSAENLAVPWLWYNWDFFRHVLCCAIDDLLTPKNRERFWNAYLADDMDGIGNCIRNAETYLHRKVTDPRLRQVIKEAFHFALGHPEQFTLSASKGRRAYQGHTPNMVAFTSLLSNIHQFAADHKSPPVAFFHDQQQEFGTSMKEIHELFGPLVHTEHEKGLWPDIKRADYDLARFSMPSSRDKIALQAVDVLLWLLQREGESEVLNKLKVRLNEHKSDFYISRGMSELIVRGRLKQMYSEDISPERLSWAKSTLHEWNSARLEKIEAFEQKKRALRKHS